jgi:hypothetical protein
MPRPPKQCVYCCTAPATQLDHVPPRNLFPKPRPRLITVPSCATHNQGSSEDDEYFRLSLVTTNAVDAHPDAKKGWQTVYRSLQRDEAAHFKQAFHDTLRKVPSFSKSGVYLGDRMAQRVHGQRQSRVVARIIRGVYYDQAGQTWPDHYVLAYPTALILERPEESKILWPVAIQADHLTTHPPNLTLGEGIFSCWWTHVPHSSFWIWALLFFNAVSFFGFAIRKEKLPAGHHGFGFP